MGLLASTGFVYAVTGALGFLLIHVVLAEARSASDVFAFRIFLQVALGSLLIFTSYAVAEVTAGSASIIKYAACTSLVLPTAAFCLTHGTAIIGLFGIPLPAFKTDDFTRWGDVGSWFMGVSFGLVAAGALAVPLFGDRLKARKQSASRLFVVASNTLAIAPFALETDCALVAGDAKACDLHFTGSRASCRLRVHDSEEEMMQTVIRDSRIWAALTRRPDIIITDLITALTILDRTSTRKASHSRG